ncbi:MAG TPA: DUF4041 domain-containing protein, partial [Polyangiaceae bacterium]
MDPVALLVLGILALIGGVVTSALFWLRIRQVRRELEPYRMVKDADAYARQLRADAEAHASTMRAEADATAAGIRTETEATAAKFRADTEAYVAQMRANAEFQAQQLVATAQNNASRMYSESQHNLQATLAQVGQQQAFLRDLETQIAQYRQELGELYERVSLQDVGLLAPRFNFGEAVEYQMRLDHVRAEQATAIKNGSAAQCDTNWTIGGSRAEGKRTTDRILKLILRAFNGECDALVSKVKFDNARAFEDRIRKCFEAINKLGSGFSCTISEYYLNLKLRELHLTWEYQDKLETAKEEQRELREKMRDQEKAQREIERNLREAEQEEARYAAALERARQESAQATGAKHAKLESQIQELAQRLAEAEQRRQRAVSQAQLTRAGHVYVLSNVGSFGENVFKIGMTRRLDPNDRVIELGDASVPFPFDVHAMIYTQDAPRLEQNLHALFAQHRVNLVNQRKEFFHVELSQIEAEVR